jgi:hypothetical protein
MAITVKVTVAGLMRFTLSSPHVVKSMVCGGDVYSGRSGTGVLFC